MTTTPFEPPQERDEEIAAADPGRGAPRTAPEFGPGAEEADEVGERAVNEGEAGEPPD